MKTFICLVFTVFSLQLFSQSLSGVSGFINCPSAIIYPDRTVYLGSSFLNKGALEYTANQRHAVTAFLGMSFLPCLEINIRITRQLETSANASHTVDRMPAFRMQLLNERKYLPAIAVGMQDFFGGNIEKTVHFNASYIVAEKTFNHSTKIIGNFAAGFAPKIYNAAHYQLLGYFAAISITYNRQLTFLAEYDTKNINVGFKIFIIKHIQMFCAFEKCKYFSASLTFQFQLPTSELYKKF